MKNIETKISLNTYVKKQIEELNISAKKSRKWFRVLAIILSSINLIMMGVAAAAIDLLLVYHNKTGSGSSKNGVILTSCAAGLIVIMFILQFSITIVRSKQKTEVYKKAFDDIQLEVIKYQEGINEYSKGAKLKLLEENCQKIKEVAITTKKNKKTSTIILKGLMGGEDV